MAGLAFLKSYSQSELYVFGFIAFVIVSLLGLLGNGILGARGFGIAGNAVLIAAGGGLALYVHDMIVKHPGFGNLGVTPNTLLMALLGGGALITLLGAAFIKRNYG